VRSPHDSGWRRRSESARPLWAADFLGAQLLTADLVQVAGLARGRLLDLGCGNRRYERLFVHARYVGYDVDTQGARPDVCGHAAALPFRDASFDAALCTQVLEHVTSPADMLLELRRVLAPGGVLILTAPQHWRLHEEPHDYWRFTKYGLQRLLDDAGFEVRTLRAQGGVWRLVGQAVNNAVYVRLGAGPIARLAFIAVNVLALALEAVWRDEADTLNYLVVAARRA
jgi:SAM-dependent methyltransferase